jgi:hypothetical protein
VRRAEVREAVLVHVVEFLPLSWEEFVLEGDERDVKALEGACSVEEAMEPLGACVAFVAADEVTPTGLAHDERRRWKSGFAGEESNGFHLSVLL